MVLNSLPMTAKHPRHIALTGPLASYVDSKVACGEYASASEVVRAALRLLVERDERRAARVSTAARESQTTEA